MHHLLTLTRLVLHGPFRKKIAETFINIMHDAAPRSDLIAKL